MFNWYYLVDSSLVKGAPEPMEFTAINPWSDAPEIYNSWEHLNNYPWRVTWGPYRIRSFRNLKNENLTEGIWLTQIGKEPILLKEGLYSNPIVVPGTDWVVAAKADNGWACPNHVVRINLKTRQEYYLEINPADRFFPVAYLPEQDRVLLYRARDEMTFSDRKPVGPDNEYRFLNVWTGESVIVQGEFWPLHSLTFRLLQPAGNSQKYWVAASFYPGKDTILYQYDASRFVLEEVQTYKNICFNSMNMWVDETNKMVYVTTNGDLLALPFKGREF